MRPQGPHALVSLLPRRRSAVKSRRRRCISLLTAVLRCGRPARRRRISWQGGRFYFLPVWQRLPCCTATGERQRPPCPHSDKSGGEGGTLRLACCTARPGGGRACLPEGQRLPCWGLCEAQRAEHRPQHCPARRRMTAPLRGPEFRLTLLGARCCPPAGGLLSGPHYKRGVAPRGRVAPQRHRGVEGGIGWDAGLSGRQRSVQMPAARWAGCGE